jgi:hypothetical protein
VALALPFLDAMLPRAWGAATAPQPRRMVCICTGLGMHAPDFFPTGMGRDYQASRHLEFLKALRNDFTVFSGFAHPNNEAAHHLGEFTFLTSAAHPELPGFRNSISLDQFAAREIRLATRFPSLELASAPGHVKSLAVNASGVNLPSEDRPSKVFARLFLDGTPEEVQQEEANLAEGRSVLDAVGEQAKRLGSQVSTADREKLDEYFTSVREMEKRLQTMQAWARKPKPKVDVPPPRDVPDRGDMIGRIDALFNLLPLALATDSTRVITLFIGEAGVPRIPGVTLGDHELSHHGQEPEKIDQLRLIEEAKAKCLARLLKKLKSTEEGGETLLRNTTVLFGSNLGNANNHNTSNLPILLAGGRFKHGQHLVVAPKGDLKNSLPLGNLYVAMLQHLGLESDKFGSSNGGVPGLETA